MDRKLRMGMAGGGNGSFIGAVHRTAAQVGGNVELVCGAFSSRRPKSTETGKDLMLPAERVYGTYREMLKREAKLPEGERMDFVVIVTPNNMHYPVAMAALDAGFHVVCDKPMTTNQDEAKNLERKIKQTGKLFCLTFNYTANPMIREARKLVSSGKIGDVRRVVAEYPQGWLASRMETKGQKQAAWRTDPKRSGVSGCIADIGSQCVNSIEFITGQEVSEVCADLHTFVKGRPLDDDGSVLFRLDGGASGVLWASQVAVGEFGGMKIRVYGSQGSVEWRQDRPNTLVCHRLDKTTEVHHTTTMLKCSDELTGTPLPAEQSEGFLGSFAALYDNFLGALEKAVAGKPVKAADADYPKVTDGIRSMAFIEAVVKSSKATDKWIELEA